MTDRRDANEDRYGTTTHTGTSSVNLDVKVYTVAIDFSDLGSGASDTVALTDFPTNAYTLGDAYAYVETAFAGEGDLAFTVGDTADADGYCASTNLDSVAAGTRLRTVGAEFGLVFEADWETAGAAVTFTATELDDVTAGRLIVHVPYILTRQCAE